MAFRFKEFNATMNTKLSAVVLVVVVLTVCMLYSFSTFETHNERTKTYDQDSMNSFERTRCIVYDRPPRTGSTTIGKALNACLRKAGYEQQKLPKMKASKRRATAIRQMLTANTGNKRLALLTRHIYLSEQDINLIRSGCDDFLYITSTAPIRERLWSAVKHLLAKDQQKLSKGSLEAQMALELLRNQSFERGQLRTLHELNTYPYLTEKEENAKIRRKIIPDYVIRKESLDQDLKMLLGAFGCDEPYPTRNVHEDDTRNIDGLFSDISIAYDDHLYKSLCKTAQQNNSYTLKLAKTFVLDDV